MYGMGYLVEATLMDRLAVLLGEAEALLALLRGCRVTCRGCGIAYDELREYVEIARGILRGLYVVKDVDSALEAMREAVRDSWGVLKACRGGGSRQR